METSLILELSSWQTLEETRDLLLAEKPGSDFTFVTDEKSIKVEQIRDLQTELSIAASEQGRVVLIGPADTITLPAQQALLKLIEEPPAKTQIILVTCSAKSLLPTLLSRCIIRTLSVEESDGEEESEEIWKKLVSLKDTRSAVMLAQSLPTKKDELIPLLENIMRASQNSPEVNEQSVKAKSALLEAWEGLHANVTPALCAQLVCLNSVRA